MTTPRTPEASEVVMTDERYPKDDPDFEAVTIAKVVKSTGGWEITRDDGWSFFVPDNPDVEPKVGMPVRFYGRGIGFTVRGLFVDHKKVFYRTAEEQSRKDAADLAASDAAKRAEFEKHRATMDARYEKLPKCFQQRISKFRFNNPDFRWEFEGYEMFCCEQAVIIAETLKTVDAIRAFKGKSWDDQKRLCPKLDEGHSGNTFGCSCSLAIMYLTDQSAVIKSYGALAPLVGSERYGCVPRDEAALAATTERDGKGEAKV